MIRFPNSSTFSTSMPDALCCESGGEVEQAKPPMWEERAFFPSHFHSTGNLPLATVLPHEVLHQVAEGTTVVFHANDEGEVPDLAHDVRLQDRDLEARVPSEKVPPCHSGARDEVVNEVSDLQGESDDHVDTDVGLIVIGLLEVNSG